MTLLVRKISKAKWYKVDIELTNDVAADAITNCLKTTRNTLSVWEIDTLEDLEKAVLALVSNQEHLDTIDVVILNQSFLQQKKLSIVKSPGQTPVKSLISKHRDIENLTFEGLGIVRDHIIQELRKNQIKRFTVSDLKKLLKQSIDSGLLNKEDLNCSIQNKLPD